MPWQRRPRNVCSFLPPEPIEQILDHLGLHLLDFEQVRPVLVDQEVQLFADRAHFEFGLQIDLIIVLGAQAVACFLPVRLIMMIGACIAASSDSARFSRIYG